MSVTNSAAEAMCSRRECLKKALGLCVIGTLAASTGACKGGGTVCSDPNKLSDAENSLRDSLHYAEMSDRNDRRCQRCGFFEGSDHGSCGSCKLLKGPVNPLGRCDSWSAASG